MFTLKQRMILKFRRHPWLALPIGLAALAVCVAVQFEMVRILPPMP